MINTGSIVPGCLWILLISAANVVNCVILATLPLPKFPAIPISNYSGLRSKEKAYLMFKLRKLVYHNMLSTRIISMLSLGIFIIFY